MLNVYMKIFMVMSIIVGMQNSYATSNTLDITCCTYHFNRDADYNESNYGVKYNHYYHQNNGISIGTYYNSDYLQSYFVGGVYTKKLYKDFSWSIDYGIVSGYRRSKFLPYIIPAISYKNRVHLHVIPFSEGGMSLSFTAVKW